jgi:hypothetical protein
MLVGKMFVCFCLIPLSNVHALEITGDPQVIQGLAQAAPSTQVPIYSGASTSVSQMYI